MHLHTHCIRYAVHKSIPNHFCLITGICEASLYSGTGFLVAVAPRNQSLENV